MNHDCCIGRGCIICKLYSKLFAALPQSPQPCEVDNIIISSSQMIELKLEEIIHPTCIAKKKEGQDKNPSLSVRLVLFTTALYFLLIVRLKIEESLN